MNNVMKCMLLVLMILYIVSPLDACPGPFDDLVVLFIGLATQKNWVGKAGKQNSLSVF